MQNTIAPLKKGNQNIAREGIQFTNAHSNESLKTVCREGGKDGAFQARDSVCEGPGL